MIHQDRRGKICLSKISDTGKWQNADLVVHVEENTWKELAAGTLKPAVALATGKLRVEDFKYIALNKFMNYFGSP